ncbi:hypothetical protein DICA3_F27050 [Diutina catenulata]
MLVPSVSGVLTLASLIILLASQIPQVAKIYSTKSVKGISPWFFTLWLAGDCCVLARWAGYPPGGDSREDQEVVMVAACAYLCFIDIVLLLQWFYFHEGSISSPSKSRLTSVATTMLGSVASALPVVPAIVPLLAGSTGTLPPLPTTSPSLATPATWLMWIGVACYLSSRLFQIRRNSQLQSTSDLSVYFVALTMAGNFVALLALATSDQWRGQLPVLVGAVGALGLDSLIVHQFSTLNHYVSEPLQVSSDAAEWYPFEVSNDMSAIDIYHHNPSEATSLLFRPSTVDPHPFYTHSPAPPSHYVSAGSSVPYQYQEPRSTNIAIRRDSRTGSLEGIKAAIPTDPTLIPSLIGTYSSVSKKMLYDKIPFSPSDFLKDEYLAQLH